ncbi:glycosyltransferase family A protein, partial [Gammaproteobacteria bacterium]|nr:glycosyltransferase family A protein [Gammaproteobacteria bacterium]
MSSPLISVIMPAYNHQRFIGEAVESVINQSLDDLELIVIDDGSTDQSGEIVKSYADPRIRYTLQENQDAYNALNRGMESARGRFISIINSDDVYHLERLEALYHCHCEHGARAVFSDVRPINDDSEPLDDPAFGWNHWHQANREAWQRHQDLFGAFLHGNLMVTTSNLFMERTVQQQIGGFAPLRYLHDYNYIFRLLMEFEPSTHYLEDQRLLDYRIHGGNTLGEAAITGRQQDLALISRYTAARLDGDARRWVEQGVSRLNTLHNELADVNAQLQHDSAPAA